jgi:hypothetical protein
MACGARGVMGKGRGDDENSFCPREKQDWQQHPRVLVNRPTTSSSFTSWRVRTAGNNSRPFLKKTPSTLDWRDSVTRATQNKLTEMACRCV